MASNQQGKAFERDMLASVRSWGWWAERFRDNTWGSMQGSNASPPDLIAVDPAPMGPDIIALWGKPTLMELKAQRHPTDILKASIPLKRCALHQLERLVEFPGEAYLVVMFYVAGSRSRSAVMIPVKAWVGAADRYGRLSVPLSALREDLRPSLHLKWVGRRAEVGPWVRCQTLHPDDPRKDT